MTYLTGAVVLVGLLGLFNLFLTLAVVRKLREHSARLGGAGGSLLPVGAEVKGVPARDVLGRPLAADWLRNGVKIVLILSDSCAVCLSELDATAAYAARMPEGADGVLALVVGEAGHADQLVAGLRTVSRVVAGADGKALAEAFQAQAFPSYYFLDRGRVVAAGHAVTALPSLPEPARQN